MIDGAVARSLHQETFLGKILDPIADKLLIVSSFSALVFLGSPSFQIPRWFFVFILLLELSILIVAAFLLKIRVDFHIMPTVWG